jgi:hypothetical protein
MKKGKEVKVTPVSNSSRIHKQGRPIREVIPSSVNKNIRENQQLKSSGIPHKREYWPYADPSTLPPIWPGEDEIKVEDY